MSAASLNRPLPRTLEAAHGEIHYLRAKLAEANHKLSQYERRRRWEQTVDTVPHKELSATEKLVLRRLYDLQAWWTAHERSGPQRIWCEGQGRDLGLSADTYGRAIKNLHACGLLTRTADKDKVTGHTRIAIELRETFWQPATITRPEPRRQGGRRVPRCASCPPETRVVEQAQTTARYICTGCGTKLDEQVGPVRRRTLHPTAELASLDDDMLGENDGGGDGLAATQEATHHAEQPASHPTAGVSTCKQARPAPEAASSAATSPLIDVRPTLDPNREIAVGLLAGGGLDELDPPLENTCPKQAKVALVQTPCCPLALAEANDAGPPAHDQARPALDAPMTTTRNQQPAPQPRDSGWTISSHSGQGALLPSGPRLPDGVLVAWLMYIAGDLPRHIIMPHSGPKKYDWRPSPITRVLMEQHLRWEITLGSEQRWRSGVTYALCWDADTAEEFSILNSAASQLYASGIQPVLERSPSRQHPGGGRLWLFFQTPVDPGRAWATAVKHAPTLAQHPGNGGEWEFWPALHAGPDEQTRQVRLPGGYFQRQADQGPCAMVAYAPDRELHWVVGRAAVALTYAARGPASWVTEPAPPPPLPHRLPKLPPPVRIFDATPVASPAAGERRDPPVMSNPYWQEKYGKHRQTLLFAFPPQDAIAWFNARHDIRQLLPREANGYARATWRGEKTPSIAYLSNNGWVDFGRSSRPNGRLDGGDAFEAQCRLWQKTRGEALQQITRDMMAEAKALLETAARVGAGVPGWVAAITTQVGWEHYDELRAARD